MIRARRIPFIFWLQDLYGEGATRVLRRRIPVFGAALGRAFGWYERRLLKRSSHIVVITRDFLEYLPGAARQRRTTVIENWAPIDALPVLPKSNDWSRQQGLDDKICLLYSGTLGMKHNPSLLLELARNLREHPEVRVVVISEGAGAEFLEQQKLALALGLDNLLLMEFQPFERMPEVHASANVLVAILEPDAGVFAVPSKVLTYLCAKRSLLLAVPSANLAARTVKQADAGLAVEPDDVAGFVAAAGRLVDDPELWKNLAANGRSYAERTFDIGTITDWFEAIFAKVTASPQGLLVNIKEEGV